MSGEGNSASTRSGKNIADNETEARNPLVEGRRQDRQLLKARIVQGERQRPLNEVQGVDLILRRDDLSNGFYCD